MIKVRDIAYVRFRAPDLEVMERFGLDFGFEVAAREGDTLYLRGSDPLPYCHVTHLGEPGFAGVAFEADSLEDLERAASFEGASPVEDLKAPGGGRVVRFSDPDGFPVEVVHGRSPARPIEAPCAAPLNRGVARTRRGELQRVPQGPARVKRIGHCVVKTSDFRESEAWYKSRFGFVSSDEIYLGDESNVITAFLRCDRGAEYVDHHTFLCIGLGEPGFDHVAFEVEDIDAVMAGHEALAKAGYEHHAGVGRHVLGSQVFDYWKDPWGHVHEHFTDSDLLNADHETGLFDPSVALGTQWGSPPLP
jgi:catechol 2,3-dioxygenase-like lactoylglutathione lyase family enzyme